jgi:hypothetical protein
VLGALGDQAVLQLEGEAAVNVQLLAVSLRRAVMKADHAAVTTCNPCSNSAFSRRL